MINFKGATVEQNVYRERPIKFRGKTFTGEIVYGDYIYDSQLDEHTIVDEDGIAHEVKPESVSQLVGYDRNGDEVFIGDMVHHVMWYDEDADEWEPCNEEPYPADYDDFRSILEGSLELVKEARL